MATDRGPRFRPGLGPSLATLCAFALLATLGSWQLQRAEWKAELIERARERASMPAIALEEALDEPRRADGRWVRASGRIDDGASFFFGVEAQAGVAGARRIAPMQTEFGVVLVDRGWAEPSAPHPPSIEADARIEGRARFLYEDEPNPFTPDNPEDERRVYWWERGAVDRLLGRSTLPLLLTPGRREDAAAHLRDPHLGYALTWFGLAAVSIGVYVAWGFDRGRRVEIR